MDDSIMVDNPKSKKQFVKTFFPFMWNWLCAKRKLAIYDIDGEIYINGCGYNNRETLKMLHKICKDLSEILLLQHEIDKLIEGDVIR